MSTLLLNCNAELLYGKTIYVYNKFFELVTSSKSELEVSTHDLRRQWIVKLPVMMMPYVSSSTSARVIGRYGTHRRTFQSECPKRRKHDIVSCIHFLTYSSNIVKEVVSTSTRIRVKNVVMFVSHRRYA